MSNMVKLTAPAPAAYVYMYKNAVRTLLEPPIYMYTSRVAAPAATAAGVPPSLVPPMPILHFIHVYTAGGPGPHF